MARFITQQIIRFILLMFAVSIVTFVLVGISPVDPLQVNTGQAALVNMSAEKRAELAAYWGVDTPIWQRYITWLTAAIHGDMGMSLRYNAPVTDVIAWRAGNSLLLMGTAWVLSGVIGFILGVTSGLTKGSVWDSCIRLYCYILISTPTFWLGLIALMVFGVMLGWFPIGFSVPIGVAAQDVTLLDMVHHTVLPALVLSFIGVANIALHTREKTIDIMQSAFIRYARAQGKTTFQAFKEHGLRNVLLPALTLQCGSIAEIFGGSVLVEQVFSYPGLGQAAVTAGIGGDAALLVGISLVSALLVFGGNLFANIMYGVIDPRMRRGSQHG